MNDELVAKLAQGLRGPVIGRSHPEYEDARKLYNAMIDKRPQAIARCADVADVIAAVNFGRDNEPPSPFAAAVTTAPASAASMTGSSSISRR